jgi:hypothetical protein
MRANVAEEAVLRLNIYCCAVGIPNLKTIKQMDIASKPVE